MPASNGHRLVVISPHLDDGVFGCGQLLSACPESIVLTVFAGRPESYAELTSWDAAAGFQPGEDVVSARREEDRSAQAALGCHPIWLDFCDSQYGRSPTIRAISNALATVISEIGAEIVFLPLGLFHSDHKLTHVAALRISRDHQNLLWFAYEDAIYRRIPNLTRKRLLSLQRQGIAVTPAGSSSDHGRQEKWQAIQEYRSQLRALAAPGHPGYEDALEAERYWRLSI
ncbi:MAG: PIG-L family deacetylase [Chloroflexota bacterium]|nr:MAG: PIG-L family deacetylase [Chloroflexota bacterium]